jgi:hypothetical protein
VMYHLVCKFCDFGLRKKKRSHKMAQDERSRVGWTSGSGYFFLDE